MKVYFHTVVKGYFFNVILLLSLMLPASVQDLAQDKVRPPDENASLQDLQKWVEKTINKNSSIRVTKPGTGNIPSVLERWKITDARFDGCRFNFTNVWEAQWVNPITPELRDLSGAQSPSAPPIRTPEPIMMREYKNVVFDRPVKKSIFFDLKGIALVEVYKASPAALKDALVVQLKTAQNEGSVIRTDEKGKSHQTFANIMVKKEAAEPLKNAFLQMLTLCRPEK